MGCAPLHAASSFHPIDYRKPLDGPRLPHQQQPMDAAAAVAASRRRVGLAACEREKRLLDVHAAGRGESITQVDEGRTGKGRDEQRDLG